jgi:hypothetical protein
MDGADRAYKGSLFSDVRDAIFANPYQKVWGGNLVKLLRALSILALTCAGERTGGVLAG